MTKYKVNLLKKQRDFLFNQWAKTTDKDKVNILVKIMDIDEDIKEHTIAEKKENRNLSQF